MEADKYFFGDNRKHIINKTETLKLSEKAAGSSIAYAQMMTGYMYDFDEDTVADLQKAIVWYAKATYQGDHHASLNLANMFLAGRGIPKDPKRELN